MLRVEHILQLAEMWLLSDSPTMHALGSCWGLFLSLNALPENDCVAYTGLL